MHTITKKFLTVALSALILSSAVACSGGDTEPQAETQQTTVAETTEATKAEKTIEETLDLYGFEGVLYALKDGEVVAFFAKGTLENGEDITLDTPMPVGSISKQFCAAAILLLQEQGKLSVDDTLDKYYPEYTQGSKITLANLLSMRSGVPSYTETTDLMDTVTDENTYEENTALIEEWIFGQELEFEPDNGFTYSNSNFFLLGNIVEKVTGKTYINFLRENFLTPLGMTNTGSISELGSNPEWAQGITYKKINTQPAVTKGAGDLISNAKDMVIWLDALYTGKVISKESYEAMTTDYSTATHYGYGMYVEVMGGVGHGGIIGIYNSYDYINEDSNFVMFMDSNTVSGSTIESLLYKIAPELMY